MFRQLLALSLLVVVLSEDSCYWNAQCPYLLYSTKTPYDTVRGDIRDYASPENCEAVSIWSIHRHGNRNPGNSVTEAIKGIAALKDEIISSYDAGRSRLCAQDIEEFRKWTWNETLEVSASFLTGTGYEELYDIGKRIRQKYPHLLSGDSDAYYFRPTLEQRTITSSIAFVHGLTDTTSLNVTIDEAIEGDRVIRPYQTCDRYQQDVKGGQPLVDEIQAYTNTEEFKIVQENVQNRLGITTQLSSDDVYNFYEICRFYRSWTPNLQSPWCSVFTDDDLVILEYRDDVRHYHRNGYGSWVNVNLGGPVLKDLYENFEAAVQNKGRNIVSYFTHDTMMEMMFCAMGVFKDDNPILGAVRDENRLWRTSKIASFSVNFIAVLNSLKGVAAGTQRINETTNLALKSSNALVIDFEHCQESGAQTYKVQLFINEKETELCPLDGCTWQQFQDKFEPFTRSNLDFCSFDYETTTSEDASNGSELGQTVLTFLLLLQSLVLFLK